MPDDDDDDDDDGLSSTEAEGVKGASAAKSGYPSLLPVAENSRIRASEASLGRVSDEKEAGVVYVRTNPETGEAYVGKAKSAARFAARQAEHNRDLGVEHTFEVVGRAEPGKPLAELEETTIRAQGGLDRQGGTLTNKRHGVAGRSRTPGELEAIHAGRVRSAINQGRHLATRAEWATAEPCRADYASDDEHRDAEGEWARAGLRWAAVHAEDSRDRLRAEQVLATLSDAYRAQRENTRIQERRLGTPDTVVNVLSVTLDSLTSPEQVDERVRALLAQMALLKAAPK